MSAHGGSGAGVGREAARGDSTVGTAGCSPGGAGGRHPPTVFLREGWRLHCCCSLPHPRETSPWPPGAHPTEPGRGRARLTAQTQKARARLGNLQRACGHGGSHAGTGPLCPSPGEAPAARAPEPSPSRVPRHQARAPSPRPHVPRGRGPCQPPLRLGRGSAPRLGGHGAADGGHEV